MIKISVITVVYNAINTIEQTIKSVLEQNYKDLEYIIIDGKSTDGTVDIIQKYTKNITYWISERDNGIYSAMNKGISMATGDVIAFLNGDDWYNEGALWHVAECFKNKNIQVLSGRILAWDKGVSNEYPMKMYCKEELAIRMIYAHPATFVKRHLFIKYGVFDENYKIAADYEWMLRIYNEGVEITLTDFVLTNFRRGGVSSTREAPEETLRVSLRALEKKRKENKIKYWEYERLKDTIKQECQNSINIICFKQASEKDLWEREDIKNKIKTEFDISQKYSIFGCGKAGKECFKFLDKMGAQIYCFWDNEKSKWGTYYNEVIINKPENMQKEKSIIIIAAIYGEEEMKVQLESMGLKENLDYVFYSKIRSKVGKVLKKYEEEKGL